MKKPRGVLFDMDGVLVHTEHLKAEAHFATVKGFGGTDVPLSFYTKVIGWSHEETRSAYCIAGGIDIEPEDYTRVYRGIYEFILVLAIIRQLFRGFSWPLACSLLLVVAIAFANVAAVRRRFHRYCRAIERSYKVLVLDQ